MNAYRSLKVALIGAGSVGSQVARLLLEHREELASRVGAPLDLVGIAVRNIDAPRDVELPSELLTTDAERLIQGADIVVELMGGIEPARTLLLKALGAGADVVTANKALIATHGAELQDAADLVGAQLTYEAAVGGAIPIIRPLESSLAGDQVNRVLGIVNGTTNFILDLMHREGASLEDALAEATALGYAEADPTADIEGFDAAQKAAILASLAFHTHVPVEAVHREGITSVTAEQVEAANRAGQVIKLLAICDRVTTPTGEQVSVRVHPAQIPGDHPLAAVHEAKNAIFVTAENAGDLMFYGAGAGGPETASAVLGDLVSAARRHVIGGPGLAPSRHAGLPIAPFASVRTQYQLTVDVSDAPGVLAAIAEVFHQHSVSIESLTQRTKIGAPASETHGQLATLVIGTHDADEGRLQETVASLQAHESVGEVRAIIRLVAQSHD
ncbi:homoserine dehydrogenase [Humidisolicoccus flavus]|uniref:homoserine dehydrogenase n=1 Tax=Humidisolicoccus flavus TaxID=3111414 RepID=UPI0032512F37